MENGAAFLLNPFYLMVLFDGSKTGAGQEAWGGVLVAPAPAVLTQHRLCSQGTLLYLLYLLSLSHHPPRLEFWADVQFLKKIKS